MGEDGELKILEMKQEESTELAVIDDKINTGLVEAFREDYDALNENPSDYVRDLVVRTFCPQPLTGSWKCAITTSIWSSIKRARTTL